MKLVWAFLYNAVLVPLSYIFFRIAGLFHSKIRVGIRGRTFLFRDLIEQLGHLPDDGPRVWFHISSYGEFEQAKPVLSALKQNHAQVSIIVSVFSPSAHENIKHFPAVDLITYLPFDSYGNAKRFIESIKPDVALIVRHDIWPNHVWRAQKCGVPLILFDASLRPDTSRLFAILRSFNRAIYNSFDDILATTPEDANRLNRIYTRKKPSQSIGDTKYDQAHTRSLDTQRLEKHFELTAFGGRRVFIAAQTHPSDEKHVFPAFKKLLKEIDDLVMILVPHEPSAENVAGYENEFNAEHISTLRLSEYAKGQSNRDFNVLIIDSIGLLANLFRFAHVAFVGGSYRPGVHNVLEPAVYGIPILFGPRIEVSSEAQELERRKGGHIVENTDEIYKKLQTYFTDETERKRVGDIAKKLVMENVGATEKVVNCILKYL